ncbi:zinc transporter 9 isoform X3 [Apteryx rowi]|uniref:zinc transporter 9 isoform X3 n=1 Tax=Apteryx rowi TaxID=308060 RepID=UPI000E1D739C|nr:zinc transporter 9 isoform X3 [Apteryx rowi]
MLPALAAQRRGCRSLYRLYVRCQAAPLRHACHGWQASMKSGSLSYIIPCNRLPVQLMSQVRVYTSNGQKKDLGSQDTNVSTPEETVPKVGTGQDANSVGQKQSFLKEPIQVKVKAVLKKREYGPKYTQNNFITGVRAINEFCLKSSDLDQLRKIKRRSPHDDTETFTVYLRSDVEAKSLEVWGSPEALARERKRRKEAEIEYRENLFRNQRLLKEYKEFFGNTKPRSSTAAMFLKGPGKVVMVAICMYGFTNMRYIASLISGVGIFMMGAGLSWYHGIMGLLHPHPIESLLWAYCILAGSLVSEGATLLVAINEIRRSARAKGLSFYQYVVQSRDPSTNVVLLEDAAAVLSVAVAATCMGLTSLTGNPYYDSLGSLGVGTLLGTVSAFLIYTNTEALLGRSIQPEQLQGLTELLESDPVVRAIHDVKATDMGMSKVRFKAEVDFDGRVVTRSYLEKQDIEQLLQEIQQVKTLEELEAFMLKHGENIIDTLGAEVDRLEKDLKQRNPDVRHVDLEIL